MPFLTAQAGRRTRAVCIYIKVKEAGTMEIKGIGGIISTYKTKAAKAQPTKSTSAAVSAKNTDRVEFGFEAALTSAKSAVAAEVRADASPQELLEAKNTAEQGIESGMIAAMMFMG